VRQFPSHMRKILCYGEETGVSQFSATAKAHKPSKLLR